MAERVLLVRAGALGDLLLLRTTVASLKAAGHSVDLLAPAGVGRALLGPGAADVEELLDWDSAHLAPLAAADPLEPGELRAQLMQYDVALAFTRASSVLANLRDVIGRVIDRDPSPENEQIHAGRWLAAAAHELIPRLLEPPTSRPTREDLAEAELWARRLPRGFVAVHPGSGSPRKNWPSDRFAAVLRELCEGAPWLLVSGPADAAAAAPLAAGAGAVQPPVLPLRVLGALLSQAGLYVGSDSGVSHLAAAWGTPTLTLFGPTDPALWAPLGERVTILRSPTGKMDGITPSAVLAAAQPLLSQTDH